MGILAVLIALIFTVLLHNVKMKPFIPQQFVARISFMSHSQSHSIPTYTKENGARNQEKVYPFNYPEPYH